MDLPEVHGRIHEIRIDEMAKAAEILGVEHEWLGFSTPVCPRATRCHAARGCFALVPLVESTERLVRSIREFRPHVLTTYDENGGYPHPPDHIRCHEVSMAAYEAAADYRLFPDAGEPWAVSKVYYNHGFLRKRMQAFQDEFARNGQVGAVREVAQGLGSRTRRHRQPDHHQRRVLEVLRAA